MAGISLRPMHDDHLICAQETISIRRKGKPELGKGSVTGPGEETMNRRQADQWEKHGQGDKIWAAQANSLFVLPIFVVLGLPCQTCHLVHKSPQNGGPGSFSAGRCLEQDIRVGIRSQPDHINRQDFIA